MARDIPIVDVWTQHIKGTPPGTNPEGENVFRNYGMLDVYHHGTDFARMIDAMDRHGVRVALMAGDNEAVAEAQNRYPGRIFGEYHADRRTSWRRCARSRTTCATAASSRSASSVHVAQAAHRPRLLPALRQGGGAGGHVPDAGGPHRSALSLGDRPPTYIDEVALDFPELRIVCGHIGWPWTEEMIAVAWKHRNVWIDTSAHVPRHYPPAFVHFLKTFGKDKVCFATDYPLLRWDRVLARWTDSAFPPTSSAASSTTTRARRST